MTKIEATDRETYLKATLNKLLNDAAQVREKKGRKIEWTEPLISHNGHPIIFPNTINIIQGQTGVHKSRMAQNVVSALITMESSPERNMGFRKNPTADVLAVYIDTERNLSERLPSAIQEILISAGFPITANPNNLNYLPMLKSERADRLELLSLYIQKLRFEHPEKHLVIVLDVIPDLIGNFNDEGQSFGMTDSLNQSIESEVTFLCIIHENPGTEKARGHLGTELKNKSTTTIQINAERKKNGDETGKFKVKFTKTGASKTPPPFYVQFDETINNLVIVERRKEDHLEQSIECRLEDAIATYLVEDHSKEETLHHLSKQVGIGISGLEKRLNRMASEGKLIESDLGLVKLVRRPGRKTYYGLDIVVTAEQIEFQEQGLLN